MKKTFIIFTTVLIFTSCNSSTDKEAGSKTTDTTTTTSAPVTETKDPEAAKGLDLVGKSDCFTCHKLTENSTGPAYAAVAAKYQGQQNMIDSLAQKVIKGGSGVWGEVPMTPHPLLPIEDVRSMIHYVMSIKN